MSGGLRMPKVNSVLREVIAEEVERLDDSRLEFVSITGVETAPDLRTARVFIDVLGSDDRTAAVDALNKAATRIQSAIGRQVRMKYTPTLQFEVDLGVLEGERMDAILKFLASGEEK